MQLYLGDVIICRQARQSKCAYGMVRKENTMPAEWMTGSLQAARIWALKHTVETGGMTSRVRGGHAFRRAASEAIEVRRCASPMEALRYE